MLRDAAYPELNTDLALLKLQCNTGSDPSASVKAQARCALDAGDRCVWSAGANTCAHPSGLASQVCDLLTSNAGEDACDQRIATPSCTEKCVWDAADPANPKCRNPPSVPDAVAGPACISKTTNGGAGGCSWRKRSSSMRP